MDHKLTRWLFLLLASLVTHSTPASAQSRSPWREAAVQASRFDPKEHVRIAGDSVIVAFRAFSAHGSLRANDTQRQARLLLGVDPSEGPRRVVVDVRAEVRKPVGVRAFVAVGGQDSITTLEVPASAGGDTVVHVRYSESLLNPRDTELSLDLSVTVEQSGADAAIVRIREVTIRISPIASECPSCPSPGLTTINAWFLDQWNDALPNLPLGFVVAEVSHQAALFILGGTAVQGGMFSDAVALGKQDSWGCSGVLVTPSVVLSAAHCAKYSSRVYFGSELTATGEVIRVRGRRTHPKYDSGPPKRNDLMLLFLVRAPENVESRGFAPAKYVNIAGMGRIIGFGSTNRESVGGFGVKREGMVPIVSTGCQNISEGLSDESRFRCAPGFEMVAGLPGTGVDTCKGDSGGPLYVEQFGAFYLAAITSRGIPGSKGRCGDGGIYVRTDAHQQWIVDEVKRGP